MSLILFFPYHICLLCQSSLIPHEINIVYSNNNPLSDLTQSKDAEKPIVYRRLILSNQQKIVLFLL